MNKITVGQMCMSHLIAANSSTFYCTQKWCFIVWILREDYLYQSLQMKHTTFLSIISTVFMENIFSLYVWNRNKELSLIFNFTIPEYLQARFWRISSIRKTKWCWWNSNSWRDWYWENRESWKRKRSRTRGGSFEFRPDI